MCKAKQNAKPSAAKQMHENILSIAKPLQVFAFDLYTCILLLFNNNEERLLQAAVSEKESRLFKNSLVRKKY
jgi:hypothetical protein